MASRGRFASGGSAGQSILALRASSASSRRSSAKVGGSSDTTKMGAATRRLARLDSVYEDRQSDVVKNPWNYGAQSGTNAEMYPWLKRQPGQRMPSGWEIQNPYGYDPTYLPRTGYGRSISTAEDYLTEGFIPDKSSPVYNKFMEYWATMDNTDKANYTQLPAGLKQAPQNFSMTGWGFGSLPGSNGLQQGWFLDPNFAQPFNETIAFGVDPKTGAENMDPGYINSPQYSSWWTPGGELAAVPNSSGYGNFNPYTGLFEGQPGFVAPPTTGLDWNVAQQFIMPKANTAPTGNKNNNNPGGNTPAKKTDYKIPTKIPVSGGGAQGRAGMAITNRADALEMKPAATPAAAPAGNTSTRSANIPSMDDILAKQNAAIIAAQKAGTMTGGMPNLKVKTGGR